MIVLKNDNDFLWNLTGLSFQKINQIKKSVDCFENALSLNPKNFSALNNLGLSHKKLKNYLKAEEYLLKAIELNPEYINAFVNLGNIKNETYYFKEALTYYNKALELNKKLPLIHLNISNIYQTTNKIQDAKRHLEEAVSIDKKFTIADQKLTSLEKYQKENSHLKSMLKQLENLELSDNQNMYLYFGLHKVYKDLKNYDKSLNYLKTANKLQRNLLSYDLNFHVSLSKKIKSIFNKLKLENYRKNNSGNNNIFILGMPRSGTSLIEKILSSHSDVSSISESNFIPEKTHHSLNRDFEGFKEFLNSNFESEYNQFIKSFNLKNKVVIDKTLTNFWYLGFIKIFFPKAKIIHVSRNPKDNFLFIY